MFRRMAKLQTLHKRTGLIRFERLVERPFRVGVQVVRNQNDLFHFYERPAAQAMFRGLRPAVAGLIAAAAWQIGRVAVVNWVAVGIAVVCGLLIARWKVHPVFLVAGSAVAGILFL